MTVGLSPTTALEGGDMSTSVVAVGVALGIPKYAPKLSLRATRPSPLTAWTKYLMLAGGLPSRPFHSRESSLPPHTAGSGARLARSSGPRIGAIAGVGDPLVDRCRRVAGDLR